MDGVLALQATAHLLLLYRYRSSRFRLPSIWYRPRVVEWSFLCCCRWEVIWPIRAVKVATCQPSTQVCPLPKVRTANCKLRH